MIKISDTEIRVRSSDPEFLPLKIALNLQENTKDGYFSPVYTLDNDGTMHIDRGLKDLLISSGLLNPNNIDEEPLQKDLKVSVADFDDNYWVNLLPGIELRSYQVLSIKKALNARRGLIQASTGAGKTFMICGVMKHIFNEVGYYPDTLIIVPTVYLMNSMKESMEQVGIKSQLYSDCRGEISGITIAHPKSIQNDIKNGSLNMKNVKVLIGDEAHHTSATTFYACYKQSDNLEFVLGFSASIIQQERLPITRVGDLYYEEARIIGAIGNILIDIPPSYFKDKNVLAKPIAIFIRNLADEPVKAEDDWHSLRRNRLESPGRNYKLVSAAGILQDEGLKSLILINTHKHGYELLRLFHEIGLGSVTACSYGGNNFYQINQDSGEIVQISKNSMEDFKNGKLQILIGTSHVYEGVDIPNLDAVIMGVVGKKDRRIIQAVGRSLRRTKNGKYAYIIDFTDSNGVLKWHSAQRNKIYAQTIGIPNNMRFFDVPIEKFQNLIQNLERFDLNSNNNNNKEENL